MAAMLPTLLLLLLGASPDPGNLRLAGRVLGPDGKPAAGAAVAALCRGALPGGPERPCAHTEFGISQAAKTGPDGRFALEQLPVAAYTLEAGVLLPGGDRLSARQELELRQSRADLELRLAPLAASSLEVLDERGQPLAEARVKLAVTAAEPGHARAAEEASGEPTLDAQGRTWVRELPEGSYTLTLRAPGFQPLSVPYRPGPAMTLRPTRLPELSGRALDPEGRPVPGLELDGPGRIDPDGHLHAWPEPGPGRRLILRAPGFFVTSREAPGDGPVDLGELRLDRQGLARGRLLGPDGKPAPGAKLLGEGQLDPDGRFEASNPGCRTCLEFEVGFSAPGLGTERRKLKAGPNQVVELGELRLAPARRLVVRLRSAVGAPQGFHQHARVRAEGLELKPGREPGQYVADDLPARPLEVTAEAEGLRPATARVDASQAELTLTLGQGLVLRGRALDAQGKPLTGTVRASGACGKAEGSLADGAFALTGLQPGPCTVSFAETFGQGGAWQPTSFDRLRLVEAAPGLELEYRVPATRHGVHLRFTGGEVAAVVVYAGAAPASAAPLPAERALRSASFLPGRDEPQGFRGALREAGGWQLLGLGPGQYTLVGRTRAGAEFRLPLEVGDAEQTLTLALP